MICLRCNYQAPQAVQDPRFCAYCRHPVAQACPYCGERYLPLRDANNHPPTLCDHCKGLLKVCQRCGRLHQLRDATCRTEGCETELTEPTLSFPTGEGSLDGTHTARWPASFDGKLAVRQVLDSEPLQQVAYRYGLLVAVSARFFFAYTWEEPTGWKRISFLPLVQLGQRNIRSLIVDDGRAYLLTDDEAILVSLSGSMAIERNLPGRFLLQGRGGDKWVRLSQGPGNQGQLVIAHPLNIDQATIVPLPVPATDVGNMLITDACIYLTTRTTVLAVYPEEGLVQDLPLPQQHWISLALSGDRLILLGRNDQGRLMLVGMRTDGTVEGQQLLTQEYVAGFSLVDRTLYLATDTTLATFDAGQLTMFPQIINLPAGFTTQPGYVALCSEEDTRLLLYRHSSNMHQLYLVHPHTGGQVSIGGAMSGRPLFCTADARLVVVAPENDGTISRIRTYTLTGGL